MQPVTGRYIVLGSALAVFAFKVWLAVHTYGTNDVTTFTAFARGVREHGPVGIYGIDFRALPGHWLYNHPPLIGYYLQAINVLSDHGIPLRVTLRTVSSAADVITGLVVYEFLRRRVSVAQACYCGVAVVASPLLLLTSGYHGNTDPLCLMLVLLGSFLIIDGRRPLWGGLALGLAVGIKLIAVVVLPVLAVYLLVHRRRELGRAAVGFAGTVGLSWGPAVVTRWTALQHHVFGYSGIGNRGWGLVRFADEAEWHRAGNFLVGPGSHLLPLLAASLPALLVWRAGDKAMEAVALSLVGTLVLLPAFALQYLSWAAAGAFLLAPLSATLYNLLGGLILFEVYRHWNYGVWTHIARARPPMQQTFWLLALLWATLVTVLFTGARRALPTISADSSSTPIPTPSSRARPAEPKPPPAHAHP